MISTDVRSRSTFDSLSLYAIMRFARSPGRQEGDAEEGSHADQEDAEEGKHAGLDD